MRWPSPLLTTLLCLLVVYSRPSAALGCVDPIPGVTLMFQGVDITQLDMFPADNSKSAIGFRHNVVSYSCSLGQTRNIDGRNFQMPDQVATVASVHTGSYDSSVSLIKTTSDIRNTRNTNAQVGGGYGAFAFSASASFGSMERTLTEKSVYISEVSLTKTIRKIQFKTSSGGISLNPGAQEFVENRLTGGFDDPSYRKFIEKYGTHYFSIGEFGGVIRTVVETESSYVEKHSEKEWEIQAKASYGTPGASVSASVGHKQTNSKKNTGFEKASTSRTRYFGGESSVASENGVADWQPTVAKNPWLRDGSLTPISSLITDPGKKTSMEQAVLQYVMEPYIVQLGRQFTYAKRRLEDMESKYRHNTLYMAAVTHHRNSFEKAFRQRMSAVTGSGPLDKDDVLALGDFLEKQIQAIRELDIFNGCFMGRDLSKYMGTVSRTESGRTCQAWSSQKPHDHSGLTQAWEFPDDDMPSNYCRSPPSDTSDRPWCYTTDSGKRWENCDVHTCAGIPRQYYFYFADTVNFDKAKQLCRDKGYILATPKSRLANRQMRKAIQSSPAFDASKDVWINLDDLKQTDTFEWGDGGSLSWQHWNYYESRGSSKCVDARPGDDLRWYTETCATENAYVCQAIPDDCYRGTDHVQYRGTVSKTTSGRTCQAWASQSPHAHSPHLTNPWDFPDVYSMPSNYCRSPAADSTDRPWCYTTDSGKRWENCDVNTCPQDA